MWDERHAWKEEKGVVAGKEGRKGKGAGEGSEGEKGDRHDPDEAA
jgi:hypothetical protein